jgi:predicted heme/steroid binding protein
MRKELVKPEWLIETKEQFSTQLRELASDPKIPTEKGSIFDKVFNSLLVESFIYHATENGANFVPVERPDFDKMLEHPEKQEKFFQLYNGTDTTTRVLGNGLYAVPLNKNPATMNAGSYDKESGALNKAYNAAQAQVRDLIVTSSLNDKQKNGLIRILDQKTDTGKTFVSNYLDIIAPNSQNPLESYPTVGKLVKQAQQSFAEKEQALTDLGPLGHIWNMMRANIR